MRDTIFSSLRQEQIHFVLLLTYFAFFVFYHVLALSCRVGAEDEAPLLAFCGCVLIIFNNEKKKVKKKNVGV